MKQVNYAHVNLLIKRGLLQNTEFLRPILAKIELSCQWLALPQLSGVQPNSGVLDKVVGGSRSGQAMYIW